MREILMSAAAGIAAALAACGGAAPAKPSSPVGPYAREAKALQSIAHRKGPPREGDWLERFDEPGQTFDEYLSSDPIRPGNGRSTLFIALLGDFDPARREVVDRTAEFMGLYFGLPVAFTEPLELSVIPEKARRVHPSWGVAQINASYVLDEVLKPRLPADAAALIAFTSSDLWPRPGWNFVFGLASLVERVGVWSIHRNGDPSDGAAEAASCLRRTLKTGTHETGHMLGMRHCILYECNMNGSNNRSESDRAPLLLCPECARKLWWCCGVDPIERYRRLGEFCARNGLDEEARGYALAGAAVEEAARGERG